MFKLTVIILPSMVNHICSLGCPPTYTCTHEGYDFFFIDFHSKINTMRNIFLVLSLSLSVLNYTATLFLLFCFVSIETEYILYTNRQIRIFKHELISFDLNCTSIGRASACMIAPSYAGWGRSFLSVVWPTGAQLVFFFSSGFQSVIWRPGISIVWKLIESLESSFWIHQGGYHDLFICP